MPQQTVPTLARIPLRCNQLHRFPDFKPFQRNDFHPEILVKYTYYGDANLSGTVDGSDYSLIDNGYLHHLTGWYNGDFNYDGVVDGSDYTLIDNTFNQQGVSLAASVAVPAATVALPGGKNGRQIPLFSRAPLGMPQNLLLPTGSSAAIFSGDSLESQRKTQAVAFLFDGG